MSVRGFGMVLCDVCARYLGHTNVGDVVLGASNEEETLHLCPNCQSLQWKFHVDGSIYHEPFEQDTAHIKERVAQEIQALDEWVLEQRRLGLPGGKMRTSKEGTCSNYSSQDS